MKVPKDISKYMPSYVAGIRLIDLALQQILCRPNARIKWQLKLHIYYPPDALKNSKAVAVPTMGTFGSGDYEDPAVLSAEKHV